LEYRDEATFECPAKDIGAGIANARQCYRARRKFVNEPRLRAKQLLDELGRALFERLRNRRGDVAGKPGALCERLQRRFVIGCATFHAVIRIFSEGWIDKPRRIGGVRVPRRDATARPQGPRERDFGTLISPGSRTKRHLDPGAPPPQ